MHLIESGANLFNNLQSFEREEASQSHDQINAKLTAIWQKHTAKCGPYVHMHYAIPTTGAIVCVGINPSFSASGWKPLISAYSLITPWWTDRRKLRSQLHEDGY